MKHSKEWRTCDRCGKEIENGVLNYPTLTLHSLFLPTNYDLCSECLCNFRRFMSNEHSESN